jgi:hypothetical protein
MEPARLATTVDIDLIGAIGAAGFHDDPVMGWVLPDPATRPAKLTAMFTSLARDMVPANGTVHLVGPRSSSTGEPPPTGRRRKGLAATVRGRRSTTASSTGSPRSAPR